MDPQIEDLQTALEKLAALHGPSETVRILGLVVAEKHSSDFFSPRDQLSGWIWELSEGFNSAPQAPTCDERRTVELHMPCGDPECPCS